MSAGSRCCKQVSSDSMSFHFHQCFNKAKVEREGKPYCGIHDPVVIKAKKVARSAKWDAEWEAKNKRWAESVRLQARADLCVAACKDLPDDIVKRMANFGRNAIEYFILGRI